MGECATGGQNLYVKSARRRGGYRFWHIKAEARECDACSRHRDIKRRAGAIDALWEGLGEFDMHRPGKPVQRLNFDLEKSAAAPFDSLRVVKERQREIR